MNIPTEQDWGKLRPGDLDRAHARESFSGLSREDAVVLFETNALFYQEDLGYMPFRCFAYYLEAYIDYLLSPKSEGDSDAASCFLSLVEFRFEHFRRLSEPTQARVNLTLNRIASGQQFYDASFEIYGDFSGKATTLIRQFTKRG